MRVSLLVLLSLIVFSEAGKSQTVTNIKCGFRHGQTFIVWDVIPDYTGFYYVYRHDQPITSSNISQAKYLGKVPYDFSLNYFLNLGTNGGSGGNPIRYLVINNSPWVELKEFNGLFVATVSKDATSFYAVTSDDAGGNEVMTVVAGANANVLGVEEIVEPISAVMQIDDLPLKENPNMFYDAYVVYGGNVKTEHTPAMTNEGCLVFNFGIIPDDDPGDQNALTMFFYGGGGSAYDNANDTKLAGMWKVSLEDVIPNFNWDPIGGENTKWIGYNENFDVYHADDNSVPPTTGIDKVYTISRIKWTLDWVLREFPGQIDSNRIYVHGSSNGCTGALAMTYLYPDKIAACDVTNAKLNAQYLGDDNPGCNWNTNGSTRKRAEVLLGTLEDNLFSDVPKIEGTGEYRLWDFANFNNLVRDNKHNSLPPIFCISGKKDEVTCWEEKIQFYNTINQNKAGGVFYWDLRSHKGGNKSIKDFPLDELLRYNLKLSYPAFSNCSLNDYPGDFSNPTAPFYDGDTIGSINGVLDWVDASIQETPDSWQAEIFSEQFELTDSTFYPFEGLPDHLIVDITPRRLQQFVNIPDGAVICMENWEGSVLKQSRTVVYHQNTSGNGLITFKRVKIRPQGNLIKIYKCGGPRLTTSTLVKGATDQIYPNPASEKAFIDLSLVQRSNVAIRIYDVFGSLVAEVNKGLLDEGEHQLLIDLTSVSTGVYLVNVNVDQQVTTYKLIRL